MKRTILLSLATLMSLYAQATFQTIYGREVVINGGMQENLYISAGTVRIDAPITGDILLCGGTLTINGTIMGDVMLLGGELIVNGQIDGSLRCLGGKLMLKGTVNKELAVASGEVICEPGSLVNGGIVASSGDLQLR